MAKDQFKKVVKTTSLTDRFSVLPLIEKGDEFLCVDADFNFLMMTKDRIAEMDALALPELFDSEKKQKSIDAAKEYLPEDPKIVERLRKHLKQNGPKDFESELQKALGN